MAKFKRLILVLLFVLPLLVACGNTAATPTSAPDSPTGETATDGETAADGTVDTSQLSSELYLYNWSDYIDESILEDFEAEYGVTVILDTFDSNEDMIAKVRAGNSGYDIVVPSDYAVTTMAAEDLLAPINHDQLTNLGNIDPGLLNQYFDEGNQYSIPYMYGITGIAYNTEEFPDGIDSWAALFDPAVIANYSGRFSMLDDERETPGAALRFLGKSLNETDPAALAEAQAILIEQKQYIAAYNSSDVNRKMASGEYALAHAWSGMAMQARNGLGDEFSGNPNIAFVIPKEGGMIWMDNLAILADSPNAYTAHVFIDFLMRPEIAARNTEYIGYLSPNAAAIDLLPQEIKDLYAAGFAPDEAMYERLEWAIRDDTTVAFTDVWTVVKGE